MSFAIDATTFSVPLSLAAHRQADQFRRNQKNPQKGKQVYLNTLAVYAVNFYLQCLGLEPELETSESWNPCWQTLMNVADLTLKSYGKIECIPVLPQAQTVEIPPDVWEDRISYFAVGLNASLREATLLGFTPSIQTRVFPLAHLQDLDGFTQYLQRLRPRNQNYSGVNLSQWFENLFDAGWQTLETLLGSETSNLGLALRSGFLEDQPIVQGAKIVDWGMEVGLQSVMLLVGLFPENGDRLGIRIQLHPQPGNPYLPANLTLALISATGETLRDVTSQAFDNFIQLPRLKCDQGETFSILVRLQNTSIRQNFTV